jgi:hypothetical protein
VVKYAHVCDVPTSKINEKAMDLHNNAWGYNFARMHSYFTKNQFYNAFISAKQNSEIKTLSNCN